MGTGIACINGREKGATKKALESNALQGLFTFCCYLLLFAVISNDALESYTDRV